MSTRRLLALWLGPLILGSVCGFAYGWEQRYHNPPAIDSLIETVSPEAIAMRNGDFNVALSLTLSSIKDEMKDYFKYFEVSIIYYTLAVREPSNREKWLAQAAAYAEKGASLGSSDWLALTQAAAAENHIGDLIGQGCPYYVTASHYDQQALDSLRGDSIWEGDEKFPTQPIRDSIKKSLKSEQDKIRAKCTNP